MEINKLKEMLESQESEPRRTSHGNIRHKLVDIIIIGLCTVICGGEDYADMEAFGIEREEWLRKFLDLPSGIPDSDTFRRLFERLKPQELSKCLCEWLEIEREKRSVIAVDGKTIRGSGNSKHLAYHVVSAFVTENQITLGEVTVNEKSNEIEAVPRLLEMLDIEGSIITADAMSCQKAIVEKITKKKADYVVGLKENQPTLLDDTVYLGRWLQKKEEDLHIVATYNLVFNASLLVGEGLGYALCYDKLINTQGTNLCFRPFSPPLDVYGYIIWKKYQVFSRAASAFLQALRALLQV